MTATLEAFERDGCFVVLCIVFVFGELSPALAGVAQRSHGAVASERYQLRRTTNR